MVECYCPDSNGPPYVHREGCPFAEYLERAKAQTWDTPAVRRRFSPAERVRPSWDEYGMIMAEAAKTRAACNRRQVGAVITDSMNRIVATGYNGIKAGLLNCSEGGCPRGQLSYAERPAYGSYEDCDGFHAEVNACDTAVERGVDLTGCNIYVTHDPCDDCAARIVEEGIARVISPNSRG